MVFHLEFGIMAAGASTPTVHHNRSDMLHGFKLLLPALMPSWRFFDTIGPSPRIEYALLDEAHAVAVWQEFRPRPARLSFGQMLLRLIWNPRWNQSLYLVSCAERLMANPTAQSEREIMERIMAEHADASEPWLQFRLVFVSMQGEGMREDITFTSPVYRREAA